MFYYNESQSEALQLPIQFDVFVNATYWFTRNYSAEEGGFSFKFEEGIFYSPGSVIYFCLVPVIGIPFISSLELRPLDPDGIMYSYPGRESQYLSTLMRWNVGLPEDEWGAIISDENIIRYPEDAFDRLWSDSDSAFGTVNGIGYQDLNCSTEPKDNKSFASLADLNNVPAKVMENGWSFLNEYNFSASFYLPVQYLHVVMYFRNLNATSIGPKGINVFSDDLQRYIYSGSPLFTTIGHTSVQTYPNLMIRSTNVSLQFNQVEDFTCVSAFELYSEHRYISYITFGAEGTQPCHKLLKPSSHGGRKLCGFICP